MAGQVTERRSFARVRGMALGLALGSAGCVLHAGVAPVATNYGDVEVTGMVAEPGLVEGVGAAVEEALARAGPADGADPALVSGVAAPVVVHLLAADLEPWRRGEGGLLYRARLVLQVQAGGRARTFTVEREVADPGSAAAAVGARAAIFRELGGEAGERVAAWLGAGG